MRETAANTTASLPRGNLILAGGTACGDILVCHEGISFWGGVDPETGQIIDAHHPDHGASLAGRVVLMPTSRGSCSGSGVLLQLALNGNAPAALVFGVASSGIAAELLNVAYPLPRNGGATLGMSMLNVAW